MSLRLKLAGSFALVILAGSIAAALAIGAVLRDRMQAFVLASDGDRARALASLLGDYYNRYGTFEGAFDGFSPGFPDMPMMRRGPGQGRGGGMMGMMRPDARPSARVPARVVVVDPRGAVLFDSGGTGAAPAGEVIERGVPVESTRGIAAYAAVGSMIDPRLRGLELDFLNSAGLAVLVSSLAAALLAVAAGAAIVVQITSPIKALARAAERIAAGDFRHRVAVARRDEIGELAGNFNGMAASLEENELLRRKMVEDAAHELRTPVSLLKANLEMMLEGVYPVDRDNLLSLNEEITRLEVLVRQLDAQNSAEAGTVPLRRTECPLPPVIERAFALHRAPLVAKRVAVGLKIETDLPPLNADPDRLLQVFSNIISNAVRHVNECGRITVTASRQGSEIVVGIENSGSSVPPEDLERIFERFYRSDPSRTRNDGGTGLGLSISREIVRRHGGRIRADNLSPDGVRFTVTLPLST
ncbi:MAG: HAMP domain-containing protein [Spirochaetales bacterium]|nr:HAMP domain-containing protein [Spirochaetales bacterium]